MKRTICILLVFTMMITMFTGTALVTYSNAAAGDIVFDFENEDDIMGWGKAWGDYFDPDENVPPVEWSNDISTDGNAGSLRVNVKYNNSDWDELNIKTLMAGGQICDLTGYEKITYDLLIPDSFTGGIKLKMALNDSWSDIPGEDLVTSENMETVEINGINYFKAQITKDIREIARANSKELVIRLPGNFSTYRGAIYLDNIKIWAKKVAASDIVYNFDSDETVMGWHKAWGSSFDAGKPEVEWSSDLDIDGNIGCLKVNVKYDGANNWSDANISTWLSGEDGTKTDLTPYDKISFDLWVPNPSTFDGTLKVETAFNDGWLDVPGTDTLDISNMIETEVHGKRFVKTTIVRDISEMERASNGQLVIQLIGCLSSYQGAVYLDNIKLLAATKNKTYDFSDGTAMGWEKAWGDYFDAEKPAVEGSADLDTEESQGALKVNVDYNNGGWDEANITVRLTGNADTKLNMNDYERVSYDVYIPNPKDFPGMVKIRTAVNDGWGDIGSISDVYPALLETVTINGVEYGLFRKSNDITEGLGERGNLVISLVGSESVYKGPVYIRNVVINAVGEKLSGSVTAPENLQVISGSYNVAAQLTIPSDLEVTSVTFRSAGGAVLDMTEGAEGEYTCLWNTLNEAEGSQLFTIDVLTSDGQTTTLTSEAFIKNSKTDINILAPAFDSTVSSIYEVIAEVTNPQDTIEKVELTLGDETLEMVYDEAEEVYKAEIDSTVYPNGAYSFFITVTDLEYTTRTFTDAMIMNEQVSDTMIVTRDGIEFILDGKEFNYTGWNAYHLPFTGDNTTEFNDKYVAWMNDGTLVEVPVPIGTALTFEQNIDGSMLEARKNGLTVLRTWGFCTDTSNDHPFYTEDWEFNEEQFQRFDYIMDSAKRHGVRVIITLQNYWNDLGGIIAYTNHLGLNNKLEFFTNPAAKDIFKDYIDFFTSRVNTVNGVSYKDDPTVFSWELMNEPRMDYNDDTSDDKSLYDPDGTTLGAWIDEMSTYIKSVDPNHMVSSGSEAHSVLVHGISWARPNEGNGNDPVGVVMNQPNMDFVTFHPYPNAGWCYYNMQQFQELVLKLVEQANAIGKPIVMEEWGIDKAFGVKNFKNELSGLKGKDPLWNNLRDTWNRIMLATFRRAGGNGTNLWAYSTYVPAGGFEIAGFAPGFRAIEDRPSTLMLSEESELMQLNSVNLFNDVDESDAPYINEIAVKGIMTGVEGNFMPDAEVTKREFVDILEKAGVSTLDISDDALDDALSRLEVAEILVDALDLEPTDIIPVDFGTEEPVDMSYSDINGLSAEQQKSLRALYNAIILSDAESFRPEDNITRAEAALMVLRATDFLYYKNSFDASTPVWPEGSLLTASNVGRSSLALHWTAAEDDIGVTKYKIYKGSDLVQTVAGNVTSYQMTGLQSNRAYTFSVEAGDGANNWTTHGPSLSVTTANVSTDDSTSSNPSAGVNTNGNLVRENGIVEVKPIVNGDQAIASISQDELDKASENCPVNAEGIKTIRIEVKNVEGANGYIQKLPAAVLSTKEPTQQLEIATDIGTLTVPGNMLSGEELGENDIVSLSIESVDKANLDDDTKNKIGNRPVIEINLQVNGAARAWHNEDAPVTVAMPYTPTAGELAAPETLEYLTVWYIDSDGNAIPVTNARYDEESGALIFTTTHFSKYAVVCNEKSFNDLGAYGWAEKSIKVLASKGITNGSSTTKYSPGENITRAQYLVFLVRAFGLSASFDSNFDDVPIDKYYYTSVGAAKALGIVVGTGNNMFKPETNISRQDMYVMTYMAMRSAGYKFSTYEAVKELVNKGIITAADMKTDPASNITRAEAAIVIHRTIKK